VEFREIVGLAAGAMTTAAFLPQALYVWKSKCVRDISLGSYSLFSAGVCTWRIYGLLIDSLAVILANGVTFVLALFILIMKLAYGRK